MKQRLAVLGSTGSIGANTLDVVARHPERFEVFALSASSQVDLMLQQCLQFRPAFAVMAQDDAGRALAARIESSGLATRVLWGTQALDTVAGHERVDTVMASIVGAAGLSSCIAAHHCVNTMTASGMPNRNPRCGTSRLVTALPQRQPSATFGKIVYE